jgi:F-type H+-transporting ATPase subunit a
MNFSPLEQFESHYFTIMLSLRHVGEAQFGVTTSILAFFFLFTLFCLLAVLCLSFGYLKPSFPQYLLEQVYKFVVGVVRSQTGSQGLAYFPIVFTLFCFIFINNFLGLIPFGFTPTAQIVLPLFMALTANLGFLIIGFYRHGTSFFNLFIPRGISVYLLPLIFIIEISTYLLRTFSLSLRLFANMMAGHTLLFICSLALSISFGLSSLLFFSTSFFLVLAVFSLEVLISFLQAYVFSVLFCVYLNDALHPGH